MKIEKKNKKGTHVGVIISFILFITILVFLYSMIEPTVRSQKNKQYFLDYIEGELIKKVSENLTSWTMTNTTGMPAGGYPSCLVVNNTELGTVGLSSIVKDKDNKPVNSTTSGNLLDIEWNSWGGSFYKIYYSNESFKNLSFTPHSGRPCEPIFITGSGRTVKYVSRTKIADVINNYQDFQNELNIPPGYYFSFSFTYSNGTIIRTGEKNVSASVYAKEKIVQYLDDEANINKGIINIRVW